jgi:hypothetical protein
MKYHAIWGTEPNGTTPEQFKALYLSEVAKFAKVIRDAGIPQAD